MVIEALKSDESPVCWHGHVGLSVDHINGRDVIDCETCGFLHVVPLPQQCELEAAYREAYYSDEKPAYLKRATADLSWFELGFHDRLNLYHQHLPTDQRHLLEIGSGPGWFLKTAQDAGWSVLGVEPSRQAAQHARSLGIRIIEGFFGTDLETSLETYDVVQLINMLEHVPDPINIVNRIREHLNPGGLISVTVPNDFNPFQMSLNVCGDMDPWWVVPEHHLNYFTFDSLSKLLTSAGFEIIEKTSSFPIEMFLMFGVNYVGNDEVGRACHEQRKQFDLMLEDSGFGDTRRDLYRALASIGCGREATIIAKKSDATANA